MFFNKKSKELEKEVAHLNAVNKEYEEKCEYYQEKYLQIKNEYVQVLKKNEGFAKTFRDSFSELSSKLVLIEVAVSKLEDRSKSFVKSDKLLGRFQEIEDELIRLSKEILRLSTFLEKHTEFNRDSSTYQLNLEKTYKMIK